MAISPYIAGLRKHVGHDLLMLPGVSAVVLNGVNEILLVRRADNGCWSIPAGAVDPGEQPADAVVREVLEETGVAVVVDRVAGVALYPRSYPNGDICQYLNVWFRCRAIGGNAQVNDDESVAVGWFRVDALPELKQYELLRIEVALGGDERAWFVRPGEHHEALSGSGL